MEDHALYADAVFPDETRAGLLPIVVGAHPQAERRDRPLAYRLRQRIIGWRSGDAAAAGPALTPLPCSDLWYLNDHGLRHRPSICLGAPEVNAATAYFGSRTPTALVVQDLLRVHLDPEYVEIRACLWGVGTAGTSAAVDVFCERYLDEFLRQAVAADDDG